MELTVLHILTRAYAITICIIVSYTLDVYRFFPSFSVPSCAIYMYVQQYWVVIRFCYSSFFFLLSFCLLSAFFSVWILYLTALRLSQKNEKAPLHNTCLCVMCACTNAHARISHLMIRLINWDFFSLSWNQNYKYARMRIGVRATPSVLLGHLSLFGCFLTINQKKTRDNDNLTYTD